MNIIGCAPTRMKPLQRWQRAQNSCDQCALGSRASVPGDSRLFTLEERFGSARATLYLCRRRQQRLSSPDAHRGAAWRALQHSLAEGLRAQAEIIHKAIEITSRLAQHYAAHDPIKAVTGADRVHGRVHKHGLRTRGDKRAPSSNPTR